MLIIITFPGQAYVLGNKGKVPEKKGRVRAMEWHSSGADEVMRILKTDPEKGLTSSQARTRLEKYGKNKLSEKKRPGLFFKFISQFSDFMVLILLAASAASFIISILSNSGDMADPVIILIIVILNAVIGTVQEAKAEKAISALRELSAPRARVLRNGREYIIPSEEVVRGDILLPRAGDRICADARLIEAAALRAEEASLTGESVPAEKNAGVILPGKTPVGDRANMLFSSTFITGGHGKAVVTDTGMDTQVGAIAAMLEEGSPPDTPLQKGLAKTGRLLGLGALAICFVIFILGLFQKMPVLDIFMISVSLAVAAIPEGLPAVVTIVLAMGVRRLAARRAVIRRLPAVETLGSTTVICTDKTGTLTQNKMRVEKLISSGRAVSSHSVPGKFLLSLGALCNNSCPKSGGGYTGDPTEAALAEAGEAAGEKKPDLEKRFVRIHEIPFDSRQKYMLTIHRLPTGGFRTIMKGAPDIISGLCAGIHTDSGIRRLDKAERRALREQNSSLAQKGMRVIAAAYRDSEVMPDTGSVPENMVFAGLIGLSDPLRSGAAQAVSRCRQAGIRTVMITGDHILTAKAIAEKAGIFLPGDRAVTGSELDNISQDELCRHIGEYSVFARVSPEHKVRIVRAFQAAGNVVAMTGDGVNDAPALRCADIGCAMGLSGTDVAKNAADMVLTDDNFSTIVNAVEQGRGIFDNIRRTIHFLLSSNIGEILSVLCAFILRLPAPLLAVQLLWINLITDSLPALALGTEPASEDIMKQPPRKSGSGIFSADSARSIIIEGCFIGALAFLAFTIGRIFFDTTSDPVIGRTMTFAVLSLSQLIHSFDLKSRQSLFRTGISGNPALIAAFIIGAVMQVSVISIPALCGIFSTAPLSPLCWLIVSALSLTPVLVVETEKLLAAA